MEFRQLVGFIAVAEELNFGRAATRLHTAQPALSQRIQQLERELGTHLFERTTRSVRLTEAGAALLEHGRRIVDEVEAARAAVVGAGRGETGTVRIGYGGASYNGTIPPLVRTIRARHPGLRIMLESNLLSGRAFDRVADREIDIGFGLLPASRRGVRTRTIAVARLVVALPAGHRLASCERVRVIDLADEPFVVPPSGNGSSVHALLMHTALEAGFSPRVVQEAPDSLTLLSLVAAGEGVSLTLSALDCYLPDGVVFREPDHPVPVHYVVLWHEANSSPAVQAVLRVIEDCLPTPSPLQAE